PPLGVEIYRCGAPADEISQLGPVGRAAELAPGGAQDDDLVARRGEVAGDPVGDALEQADHADGRRRIDGAGGAFVVEADVAARHRGVERPAGLGDAPARLAELEEDVRLL